MTTQSQQQQMAQQQQARATNTSEGGTQLGAADTHEEFCGGACGAGAGAAVIWRPITVAPRQR